MTEEEHEEIRSTIQDILDLCGARIPAVDKTHFALTMALAAYCKGTGIPLADAVYALIQASEAPGLETTLTQVPVDGIRS